MLSALTRPRPGAGEARGRLPMEKNVFMREVLTLIHTDKGFVDALWQDYVASVD
ncbi:hypothetical protein B0H14DRAFT_3002305 [Mycena olivaceomarginata]|nr:hypothetical protein B0H14DRAFT_3002305 [Mycena olivaceomarginata]